MTTSVHRVRNIVVEAKQRPLSPGHRLPDIFYSRFLSLLPCRFHFFPFWSGLIYRSLGVASEPSQECLLFSGNHQMVSHLVAAGNLCLYLRVSPGGLAAGFSAVTFHCGTRLLGHSTILCHQSLGETTGEKGTPFCQPVPLSTPILW